MIEYILEQCKLHGPLAAVVAAVVYFGDRHVKRDARNHEAADVRLRDLETKRVVPEELTRVHERLNSLSDQLAESQREILVAIAQLHR